MELTQNYKYIEANGRKFRLNKMSALVGNFMLFKMTKFLPAILENLDFDKVKLDGDFNLENLKDLNLTKMFEPIFNMTEKEFRYIQENCLKTVEEILPAGPQAVLNDNGQWGVLNVEFDMALVMNLTIQSLVFNLKGFFNGLPFSSIMSQLTSSQQNMKI